MKQLVFTAIWGFHVGYSLKEYLPVIDYSGSVEVQDGKLTNIERISFRYDSFGSLVRAFDFEAYDKKCWESVANRSFDGFRFTVEAEDDCQIRILTKAGNAEFCLSELEKEGHLLFPAGGKYMNAPIHIEKYPPDWFLAQKEPYEVRITPETLNGDHGFVFGVHGTAIRPGETVRGTVNMELPQVSDDQDQLVLKLAVRYVLNGNGENESCGAEDAIQNFSVRINGTTVWWNDLINMNWDVNARHLDESIVTLSAQCSAVIQNGENTVEIVNEDISRVVVLQMVRLIPEIQQHVSVVGAPQWTTYGQPFRVQIQTNRPAKLNIVCEDGCLVRCSPDGKIPEPFMSFWIKIFKWKNGDDLVLPIDTEKRWQALAEYYAKAPATIVTKTGINEFYFLPIRPFENAAIRFTDEWSKKSCTALIGQCWQPQKEAGPLMMTGVEFKVDNPSQYQYLLDRTLNHQLGNMVLFRRYRSKSTSYSELWDIAALCRKNGLYVDAVDLSEAVVVVGGAGENIFAVGGHEDTGLCYNIYFVFTNCQTVREAYFQTIDFFRMRRREMEVKGIPFAEGDSTPAASRFLYLAGYELIRHETFCQPQLMILANARGAGCAFGKDNWGVHVASQHNYHPELDPGIRRFWLAFYLPWISGAKFVFEEDSLFQNNKENRMVHDDYMTQEKQKINAAFHKYTQTHPRKGKPVVHVAMITGRYSTPFNGVSTPNGDGWATVADAENVPIWGGMSKNVDGKTPYAWGYRQPEKGWFLLEQLAPGIRLEPLHQDIKRLRPQFNADPKGEFDLLPIEAPVDAMNRYKLAVLFDWNTMEQFTESGDPLYENDYEKLRAYAENGGTLLLSTAQLTTRTDRELLLNMRDVQPFRNGKVADLCGVNILGCSEDIYSGAVGVEEFAGVDLEHRQDLIRRPHKDENEDGPCWLTDLELTGAVPVIVDRSSGKPLLVRHDVGQGHVYLLCVHAFPGHESIKYLMANLMDELIQRYAAHDITVNDPTDTIYWSDWREENGCGKLYLLNTDWTEAGNVQTVTISSKTLKFSCSCREGELLELSYTKNFFAWAEGEAALTSNDCGGLELHGFGDLTLTVIAAEDGVIMLGKDAYPVKKGQMQKIAKTLGGEKIDVLFY